MTEFDKPSQEQDAQQPSSAKRRPWHAPQFMQTDIALTKAQNAGDSDASSFLS